MTPTWQWLKQNVQNTRDILQRAPLPHIRKPFSMSLAPSHSTYGIGTIHTKMLYVGKMERTILEYFMEHVAVALATTKGFGDLVTDEDGLYKIMSEIGVEGFTIIPLEVLVLGIFEPICWRTHGQKKFWGLRDQFWVEKFTLFPHGCNYKTGPPWPPSMAKTLPVEHTNTDMNKAFTCISLQQLLKLGKLLLIPTKIVHSSLLASPQHYHCMSSVS